jgi:steroid 5-alpha reductase family enzyme
MIAHALSLIVTGAGIVGVMMLLLWIVRLLIRNAAIVDVGWATGLGLLAAFTRMPARATLQESM